MVVSGFTLQCPVLVNQSCLTRTVAFLVAFAFECFSDSDAVTRALVGSFCSIFGFLFVWCMHAFWRRRLVVQLEERPLAYMDPNDPCEKVVDEDEELFVGENAEEQSQSRRPPVFMAVRRFLKFPNPFKPVLTEGGV